jgi:hypothetical protein
MILDIQILTDMDVDSLSWIKGLSDWSNFTVLCGEEAVAVKFEQGKIFKA